ncbi:alpha/beta hydrolase [Mangrovimonas spongiae]|uniref:Alpha/beta hydrolase n=1 Tax=Mangrovimonas spongiae TaxID=2494697 RepID=A0A3R9M7X4_9FLAO|nr:alpha/beta hydrolase [Mangrovimonas spongiae]RSK39328.1 alpha/beta hydrolase [Mangrovimonas spongiae]
MNAEVIHVYFMPGMAANPKIFENIELPSDKFESHWLEWEIPLKNESLTNYAKRLSKKVTHDNVVLLGVSFGGILVQEMQKYVQARKVIIVSTVKTKYELPKRLKFAKYIKVYKLIPARAFKDLDFLARFALGKRATKRVELYKKYLSVNDAHYMRWSIQQIVCWDVVKPLEGVVHIHGDKDLVFPYYHIKNCITVKGGTHIMILNRYKWFNEHLPKLILS